MTDKYKEIKECGRELRDSNEGESSANISFEYALTDNKGLGTTNGVVKRRIVGYALMSTETVYVPRVPFEDAKDIYKFDKDKIITERIPAGNIFFLKPAELFLFVIKKEYAGRFTGGSFYASFNLRLDKDGNPKSFYLRLVDKSSGKVVSIRDYMESIVDRNDNLLDGFKDWELIHPMKKTSKKFDDNIECVCAYFRNKYYKR